MTTLSRASYKYSFLLLLVSVLTSGAHAFANTAPTLIVTVFNSTSEAPLCRFVYLKGLEVWGAFRCETDDEVVYFSAEEAISLLETHLGDTTIMKVEGEKAIESVLAVNVEQLLPTMRFFIQELMDQQQYTRVDKEEFSNPYVRAQYISLAKRIRGWFTRGSREADDAARRRITGKAGYHNNASLDLRKEGDLEALFETASRTNMRHSMRTFEEIVFKYEDEFYRIAREIYSDGVRSRMATIMKISQDYFDVLWEAARKSS